MPSEDPIFGEELLHSATAEELAELDKCFQLSREAWSKAAHLLALQQAGATMEFKKARDVQTVLLDPWRWGVVTHVPEKRQFRVEYSDDEKVKIGQIAQRLAERHNAQLIGEQFVHAVDLALHSDEDSRTQGLRELSQLRTWASKNGFFLQQYDEPKMRKRVCARYVWQNDLSLAPQYLITETSGKHPDPTHRMHASIVPAADCQIALPLPGERAASVVELPRPGDEVIDEGLADYIAHNPSAVASIDDIVCIPDMNGLQLASLALDRGLAELVHHANAGRRGHPIHYVAASIATLKGIVLRGDVEMLLEELPTPVIPNGRSHHLFDRFASPHCGAFSHAYTLRNRRVSVAVGEKNVDVLVDWSIRVAPLNKPSPVAAQAAGEA